MSILGALFTNNSIASDKLLWEERKSNETKRKEKELTTKGNQETKR